MLVEALVALAAAGGTTLVGAAVTDGWESAKRGFAQLFGRGDEARTAAVEERLERTRVALQAAGPQGDRVRLEHQAAWTARLEDLLADQPQVADELSRLVEQVAAATGARSAGHVVQHAVATDRAQQVVQGHGQQVNTFGAAPASGRGDDGT